MIDFLPLFPLKLVAFPGERLNLHIFEPRYKQLIRACRENQITFGIPAFIDNKIVNIGTEIKLEKIENTYENGELDVRTLGIGVFRIEKFYSQAPNKLYAGADIERLEYKNSKSNLNLNEEIFSFLKELFTLLDIPNSKMPESPKSFTSFQIAHHLGMSVEQEYNLLRIESEERRQEYILEHLKKVVPVAKEMETLKERAKLNGHFKKIIPPSL